MTAIQWKKRLSLAKRCLCDSARLMVGVPNYDTYVAHMKRTHPQRTPMTYAQFVRDRQDARYGGNGKGGFHCC